MNEPVKGAVKPEDAINTSRSVLEQIQLLRATFNIKTMQSDIRDTRDRLIKVETDNKWRGKFLLGATFLASIYIAVLAGALFSWLFSLDGVTTDMDLMDYLGLLAIVLTILGAGVFFYVTFLTIQRNKETNEMFNEMDERRRDRQKFEDSVVSSLGELREDVQRLKDKESG